MESPKDFDRLIIKRRLELVSSPKVDKWVDEYIEELRLWNLYMKFKRSYLLRVYFGQN
jgi:hypothetical protein